MCAGCTISYIQLWTEKPEGVDHLGNKNRKNLLEYVDFRFQNPYGSWITPTKQASYIFTLEAEKAIVEELINACAKLNEEKHRLKSLQIKKHLDSLPPGTLSNVGSGVSGYKEEKIK
jgi:hypothetical protein